MIKTYDDDNNQLCEFYEEGESLEGLFDWCSGYCDDCNTHPNCMYRQNLALKEKLKAAENILCQIAKTMEVCYQQGKTGVIGYTCLDAKKVYELLLSYELSTLTKIGEVE